MDMGYLEKIFNTIFTHLDYLSGNLDPSLFQNIILGVLAIFIPFAIVFLTDILNSKQEKRNEFEKMVLSYEVLGARKIFWLAVVGMVFFAFFSGKDISSLAKVISITAVIILIFLFWTPFNKILRFSEGQEHEFEISFLRKLRLSNLLRCKNKGKKEKSLRAWGSFWSEKSEINEKDFISIFISHIDDAIRHEELHFAIQLAQTYVNNITKQNHFCVGCEILPKILEWDEAFWNKQQFRLRRYRTEKSAGDLISQKYFPTFKNWILRLLDKLNPRDDILVNWHYFREDFFQTMIKGLLKNRYGQDQLFSSFKNHIEKNEKRLERIKDEKEKEEVLLYITHLFSSFYPTFFDGISTMQLSYGVWGYAFPPEWKITINNKGNRIPHVILSEFLKWSEGRIFRKEGAGGLDKGLSEIIRGIFPHVHPSLFTAFLMLFFSGETKDAIEKEPNFLILNLNVSRPDTSLEDFQKKETVRVILHFLSFWTPLINREKLHEIKIEVESNEIKEICKNSKRKEQQRKDILELIELLLLEIKNTEDGRKTDTEEVEKGRNYRS